MALDLGLANLPITSNYVTRFFGLFLDLLAPLDAHHFVQKQDAVRATKLQVIKTACGLLFKATRGVALIF